MAARVTAAVKRVMDAVPMVSAPQLLLVGCSGAALVSWRMSSAAKLQDHLETQVYVSHASRWHLPPAATRHHLILVDRCRAIRCAWRKR